MFPKQKRVNLVVEIFPPKNGISNVLNESFAKIRLALRPSWDHWGPISPALMAQDEGAPEK